VGSIRLTKWIIYILAMDDLPRLGILSCTYISRTDVNFSENQ
jgi:hypothetical protein